MSPAPSANPLIKEDLGSTIDAISQYVAWQCQQKGNDPEAHPGQLMEWQVVYWALQHCKAV
jgi:hypothetical protein